MLSLLPFLPLLQLGDILSTVQDLSFVFKILVFVFILFQLYVWLNDQPFIFAAVSIGAAYLIFFHSILMTFVATLFLVMFTNFGNMLQQTVFFGFAPLMRGLGFNMPQEWGGGGEEGGVMTKIQQIETKMQEGQEISNDDQNLLLQHYKKQQQFEQAQNRLLQRRAQ
ncbi:MAG TPA: hypothetical protein VGQ00_02400 [Candidatus Norongarragalinales archaeon]|nr:hypothetical protein [Candidatus Norongarragalinales archaeon]